jgi:hypothetical protein
MIRIDDYHVTECSRRPASFRFEASRHDGEPSLFGATLNEVISEIDERAMIFDAVEGRR